MTFDAADVDTQLLRDARREAFGELIKTRGVSDLYSASGDDWDYFAFVLLMKYHAKVMQRHIGGITLNFAYEYRPEQQRTVPF